MKTKKTKQIERAIRLTYSSLESHLPYIHKGVDKSFEKRCVKEYAEVIKILAELL